MPHPRMNNDNKNTLIVAGVVFAIFLIGAIIFGVYTAKQNSTVQTITQESTTQVPSQSTATSNASNADSNENASNNVAQAPQDYTQNVKELLQFPIMQGGCEITSLTCNLNALGFEVEQEDIADNYLVYAEDDDWSVGYSGDPYYNGFGFPACIVSTANAYLADQGDMGAQFEAIELKGESFDALLEYVNQGWPVIVWTTMYFSTPWKTGLTMGDYEWYENEHCVVLYGTDEDGDLLIMDPIDGLVTRSANRFAIIYEDCGSMGVLISSKK